MVKQCIIFLCVTIVYTLYTFQLKTISNAVKLSYELMLIIVDVLCIFILCCSAIITTYFPDVLFSKCVQEVVVTFMLWFLPHCSISYFIEVSFRYIYDVFF